MDAEAKTKGNYAGGENVGDSWTDKIMGMKSSQAADTSQAEGVDDDEWVCQFKQYALCSKPVKLYSFPRQKKLSAYDNLDMELHFLICIIKYNFHLFFPG